ncbi:unnamed protein product [Closterium sp. NIES-54]
MLPYVFPDLAAFATVADLVAHLRTSDARYRAALPTEFLPTNIPTTEQPADFLTKALHFPDFNRCSVAIGQVRLADVGDSDDDVQQ